MRIHLPLLFLATVATACAPESRDGRDIYEGANARGETYCKSCGGSGSGGSGSALPDLEGDWAATAQSESGRTGSLGFQIPEKVVMGRFDISLDLLEDEGIYYIFDGAGTVSASGRVTMTGDLSVTLPDGEELSARGETVISAGYSSDKDILEGTMNLGGDDIWGLGGDDVWGLGGDDVWGFSATR